MNIYLRNMTFLFHATNYKKDSISEMWHLKLDSLFRKYLIIKLKIKILR